MINMSILIIVLPYDVLAVAVAVGPARGFLGEAEKTMHTMCGFGPASASRANNFTIIPTEWE